MKILKHKGLSRLATHVICKSSNSSSRAAISGAAIQAFWIASSPLAPRNDDPMISCFPGQHLPGVFFLTQYRNTIMGISKY